MSCSARNAPHHRQTPLHCSHERLLCLSAQIAFRFKKVEQVALTGSHIDITMKHTGDEKDSSGQTRQVLRFTVPTGAASAHEFVQEMNARIASLEAQGKLQSLEERRMIKRAEWIELLVDNYQQKLLELLQQPVGIAITAEEVGAGGCDRRILAPSQAVSTYSSTPLHTAAGPNASAVSSTTARRNPGARCR